MKRRGEYSIRTLPMIEPKPPGDDLHQKGKAQTEAVIVRHLSQQFETKMTLQTIANITGTTLEHVIEVGQSRGYIEKVKPASKLDDVALRVEHLSVGEEIRIARNQRAWATRKANEVGMQVTCHWNGSSYFCRRVKWHLTKLPTSSKHLKAFV